MAKLTAYRVTMEVEYECVNVEDAREFARHIADKVLDEGAYKVNSTAVAELGG